MNGLSYLIIYQYSSEQINRPGGHGRILYAKLAKLPLVKSLRFSSRLNSDRRSRSSQLCNFCGGLVSCFSRFIATVRKIRNCFGSTTLAAARMQLGDCRWQVSIPGRLCRSKFRLPTTITGCYANRQRTFRPDGQCLLIANIRVWFALCQHRGNIFASKAQ